MRKFLFVLILLIPFVFASKGFAGQGDCSAYDNSPLIHCDYITGLDSDLSNGRYIKITATAANGQSDSSTECVNNTAAMSVSEKGAEKYNAKNGSTFSTSYSICNTSSGSNCRAITTSKFTINGKAGNFTASPKYTAINIGQYTKDFKKCDATKPISRNNNIVKTKQR